MSARIRIRTPIRVGSCRSAALRPILVGMAAAATAASSAVVARDADGLPFPARVAVVMERGEIEGHAVRILRFRSSIPLMRVIADTRRAWALDAATPTVGTVAGEWRTISRQEEGGFRTLQVRPLPAGGTEGLVTIWNRAYALPAARLDVARLLPPQAQIQRRLAALDSGRRSETVVAFDQASPAMFAERLRVRLEAAGLRSATPERAQALADGEARAHHFQGDGLELALTVHAHDGGSVVVMHLVEMSR